MSSHFWPAAYSFGPHHLVGPLFTAARSEGRRVFRKVSRLMHKFWHKSGSIYRMDRIDRRAERDSYVYDALRNTKLPDHIKELILEVMQLVQIEENQLRIS